MIVYDSDNNNNDDDDDEGSDEDDDEYDDDDRDENDGNDSGDRDDDSDDDDDQSIHAIASSSSSLLSPTSSCIFSLSPGPITWIDTFRYPCTPTWRYICVVSAPTGAFDDCSRDTTTHQYQQDHYHPPKEPTVDKARGLKDSIVI